MPPKKRSTVDMLIAAQAAGAAIQEQDRQSEVRSAQSKVATLPLSKIIDRVTDIRKLNSQHVEKLMQSIAVLGLLQPLVVDSHGRLLAGGHRKAAIYLLKEQMPVEYAKHFPNELVPVRVLNFDATVNADLALQVEIAENEIRRDYTSPVNKVSVSNTNALTDLKSILDNWQKAYGGSDDEVLQSIEQDMTLLLDRLTKII
jgi:ParB family transcriptional regulator, chromosome partitioning protein